MPRLTAVQRQPPIGAKTVRLSVLSSPPSSAAELEARSAWPTQLPSPPAQSRSWRLLCQGHYLLPGLLPWANNGGQCTERWMSGKRRNEEILLSRGKALVQHQSYSYIAGSYVPSRSTPSAEPAKLLSFGRLDALPCFGPAAWRSHVVMLLRGERGRWCFHDWHCVVWLIIVAYLPHSPFILTLSQ